MSILITGNGGFAALERLGRPSKADPLDIEAIEAEVAGTGVVVHRLDTRARPQDEMLDRVVMGTRNVLAACLKNQRPVLLVSSADVYGSNPFELAERANRWIGASSRFAPAVALAAAEQYTRAFGKKGLSYCIARYFDVYGPGEGGWIGHFIDQLEAGKPLNVEEVDRCVCYVDDALQATRLLIEGLESGDITRTVVNVAHEDPISVAAVAHELQRLAGKTVEMATRAGRMSRRVPDLELLFELTDFEAEVPVVEGLRRTLDARGLLDEQPVELDDVPLVRPNLMVSEGLVTTIAQVVHSGRLSNEGPRVQELEERLANWLEVPELAVVSSGSMALYVAAATLDREGPVVLPSFTFPATASAFALNGHELVFADIDPDTWTLDPDAIPDGDFAAIVPVNVYGVPADLTALAEIAAARGAELLVDDAHGLGSRGHEIPKGTVRCMSLHATKLLVAAEGGVIIGSAPRLERVRYFRNHGRGSRLLDVAPGLNARMDELRATLALEQLEGLDEMLEQRRADAHAIRTTLRSHGWEVQRVPAGVISGFQNLGARLPGVPAARVVAAFRAHGVRATRYFHPLLHKTTGFWQDASLPVTEALYEELVCLPLHSHMRRHERAAVLHAITAVSDLQDD